MSPHLRFRVFDLASHAPDQTLFCVLFIAAWSGGNRPDHLAILMLGTFVQDGVTGVATHVSFLTVQQLIDLRHVRHIGRRAVTQQQATAAQIAIDDLQDPACQLMFFQQAAEVEYRGFIGNPIQIQARELAQNRRFI